MKQFRLIGISLSILLLSGSLGFSPVLAQVGTHQNGEAAATATSADGTAIAYYEYGHERPMLVFVHGWSCDASYWREQVDYFKENYHIVLIDLAGHGRSESERENYTMESFGRDVKAVVEAIAEEKIILVGHSMGALVIAEAARLMPEKVVGLIAVDDLHNVAHSLAEEELEAMTAPFRKDFAEGVRGFVSGMLHSDHVTINEWVISDMSLADSTVALSAMRETLGGYVSGDVATLFDELDIPVVAVNTDLWPTDVEANRRHIKDFELIELAGLDHFLMLKAPERFNPALKQAVEIILKKLKES